MDTSEKQKHRDTTRLDRLERLSGRFYDRYGLWQKVLIGMAALIVIALGMLAAKVGVGSRAVMPKPPAAKVDTGETKTEFDKMHEAIAFAAGDGVLLVNQHTDTRIDEIRARLDKLKPRVVYRDRWRKALKKKRRGQ